MKDSEKHTRLGYLSGIDKNELVLCKKSIAHYLQTFGHWLDTHIEAIEVHHEYIGHGQYRQEDLIYSHIAPTIALGLQHNTEMWCEDEGFESYLERAWENLGFLKLDIKFVDDSTLAYIGVIDQLIEEDALALVMGMGDREQALRALGKAAERATEKSVVTSEMILYALEGFKYE